MKLLVAHGAKVDQAKKSGNAEEEKEEEDGKPKSKVRVWANCDKKAATMKKCTCKLVRYCSRECQREDWREHKKTCPVECERVEQKKKKRRRVRRGRETARRRIRRLSERIICSCY